MDNEIILKKFAERFTQLIRENETDVASLLQYLGIKSKSTIYRYMNAEMTPKITTVKFIAEFFNVNLTWLMGYDVPMRKIRTISETTDTAVVIVYGTIPAGIPLECIEDIIGMEEISGSMLKGGKQYFGLQVKGDSMLPEYINGDILIIEKVDDCESGQDCIVMVNGSDGTFKRVFKNENGIILQPLNPTFTPMVYTNEEIEKLPVKIIGKVVELRRKK